MKPRPFESPAKGERALRQVCWALQPVPPLCRGALMEGSKERGRLLFPPAFAGTFLKLQFPLPSIPSLALPHPRLSTISSFFPQISKKRAASSAPLRFTGCQPGSPCVRALLKAVPDVKAKDAREHREACPGSRRVAEPQAEGARTAPCPQGPAAAIYIPRFPQAVGGGERSCC